MIEGKIVKLAMLNRFYQLIRTVFVLQEEGKGLSTNDYTDADKVEVAKIADLVTTGGEPNKINTVKVNGTALTPDSNKAVNVDVPVFSGSGKGEPGMGTEECVWIKIADRYNQNYITVNFTDNGLTLSGSIYDDMVAGGSICGSGRYIPDETRVNALITTALADVSGVDFVLIDVGQDLPATGEKGKFYLKNNGGGSGNSYDEYVWINKGTEESPDYGFEKLGTMQVDLTGYIRETDIQFATNEDIEAMFSTPSGGE